MSNLNLSRDFETKVLLSLIIISLLIIPCEPQGSVDLCRGRGPGSKYPDWNDCHRYLTCSATGIQMNLLCLRGQVFDRWSRECETSVDIPCNATKTQKSMVGTKCSVEGEIKPSAVFCERFLVCRNGYNYPINCPLGHIFSNKAYECILAPDPCATDPVSENKKSSDLRKRKKSPYIGICDDKISRNISEPLHCTMYIQCMLNHTTNTTIVFISICESGLLYSNETNHCEKPAVVVCGQRFRNRSIYGSEPKPKEVFRFLEEKNRASGIDGNIESTTKVESKTTSDFGRRLEVGGAEYGNPDSISSLEEYEDDTSTIKPILTTEQENEDKDDSTTEKISSLGKITSTTTVEYTTLEPTRIPDPSPGWGKFTIIILFIVCATFCIISYCIYRWKTVRPSEEYYVTWTNDETPTPKYLSQETYV